jgi:ATP adenylyltransferase
MSEPVPEAQDGVGAPDGFRRLWTPHRLAYIKDAGEGGCPLCRIPTLPDEEGLIIARGEVVYPC